MVIGPPTTDRPTVPDVYVVSEFEMPLIAVCWAWVLAPEILNRWPVVEKMVMLLVPSRVTVPEV
jgi:hypothetical protein